ncbi:hypothetical protein, partial [Hyella patelloides]|uniref:hypothetical protein n=1 Tax=Hyella patelloides TaxID=1982969 RepID=UPI00119EEBFF
TVLGRPPGFESGIKGSRIVHCELEISVGSGFLCFLTSSLFVLRSYILDFSYILLEAFRTAMSFRFVDWLNKNRDVFIAYKASLGFVWA